MLRGFLRCITKGPPPRGKAEKITFFFSTVNMGAILIPSEYGYVRREDNRDGQYLYSPQQTKQVLTSLAASALYLFALGAQTGKYRRAAGVPYPYGKFFHPKILFMIIVDFVVRIQPMLKKPKPKKTKRSIFSTVPSASIR